MFVKFLFLIESSFNSYTGLMASKGPASDRAGNLHFQVIRFLVSVSINICVRVRVGCIVRICVGCIVRVSVRFGICISCVFMCAINLYVKRRDV